MSESDKQDKVTEDYPGLIVHDDRVTGSITVGHSRLPIWAFVSTMVEAGFAEAKKLWDVSDYTNPSDLGIFLQNLMEQRKEFGRLLCVLADV